MKKISLLFFISIVVQLCVSISLSTQVNATDATQFNAGRIIDDNVFTNSKSMNPDEIQRFLNSKMRTCDTYGQKRSELGGGTRAQWAASRGYSNTFTCLKDYYENPNTRENNYGGQPNPAGSISAAQIIYNYATQFNINPQVLIVTLQKEKGMITDDWPILKDMREAMGFGCPDNTAPGAPACDPAYGSFSTQIYQAARHFRGYMDRQYCNSSWCTPYTLGNNEIRWQANSVSCGTSVVNIQTLATSALYSYTPYRPNQAALNAGYGIGDSCSAYGNRNFYLYFTDWFGSTLSGNYYTCREGSNINNVDTGRRILANRLSSTTDNLSLVLANQTNTGCVEFHTWANSQLQVWLQHIGSNSYTFNDHDSKVVSGLISNNNTGFYKIDYTGTNSGKVEIHGWSKDMTQWVSHIATNAGPIDPSLSEIITADTNGDGVDEFYLINYTNTNSGKVEIHGWSKDFQSWVRHSETNLMSIDPTKGRVIAADLDGDRRDEFIYVKTDDTQSGRVEFHSWSPDLKSWTRHVASNYPASGFNRLNDDIVVADTDGNGRDNLLYVKYSNTSSGRVEVHGWSDDQQIWISHTATNSGSY